MFYRIQDPQISAAPRVVTILSPTGAIWSTFSATDVRIRGHTSSGNNADHQYIHSISSDKPRRRILEGLQSSSVTSSSLDPQQSMHDWPPFLNRVSCAWHLMLFYDYCFWIYGTQLHLQHGRCCCWIAAAFAALAAAEIPISPLHN